MNKQSNSDACRRFRSNLSDVVSRDASSEVLVEAEAHRDQCSDCESEYQLAVRVEHGLGILPALSSDAPSSRLEDLFSAPGSFDTARAVMPLAFDPTLPVELSLNCQEFKDLLGDFVSEELPVGTLLEGVEHASACRSCGDELATMQTIQDAFRNMAELEAPTSIFTSLMARIDADEAAEAATEGETAKVRKLSTARSKLLPVLG